MFVFFCKFDFVDVSSCMDFDGVCWVLFVMRVVFVLFIIVIVMGVILFIVCNRCNL